MRESLYDDVRKSLYDDVRESPYDDVRESLYDDVSETLYDDVSETLYDDEERKRENLYDDENPEEVKTLFDDWSHGGYSFDVECHEMRIPFGVEMRRVSLYDAEGDEMVKKCLHDDEIYEMEIPFYVELEESFFYFCEMEMEDFCETQ